MSIFFSTTFQKFSSCPFFSTPVKSQFRTIFNTDGRIFPPTLTSVDTMGSHSLEIPPEIAQHFRDYFPEYLDYDDVLRDQECVYQSLQSRSNHVRDSTTGRGLPMGQEAHISHSGSMDSELAEAIASSLQVNFTSTSESPTIATETGGSNSSETSDVVVGQDDVDPDDMSYEQLQSLTEAVGNESKGLEKGLISRLPSKKFKIKKKGWLFSKKSVPPPQCVICIKDFECGECITTLPCSHEYHKTCIEPWLEDNKTCPSCKFEISVR